MPVPLGLLQGPAFDRTYEGLKPQKAAHHLLKRLTFDRTYEGLKRGPEGAVPEEGVAF